MEFEITYKIQCKDYAQASAAVFRASSQSRLTMWMLLGSAILLLLVPLSYKEPGAAWSYPFVVVPFADRANQQVWSVVK
ncbi:MAG TPA: hypothetical protein VE133_09665 [Candidatus Sulfotelmatobacter sp.]|nr:hypothetical protein [Candidatus Sulfotelmatobacter sp.]